MCERARRVYMRAYHTFMLPFCFEKFMMSFGRWSLSPKCDLLPLSLKTMISSLTRSLKRELMKQGIMIGIDTELGTGELTVLADSAG